MSREGLIAWAAGFIDGEGSILIARALRGGTKRIQHQLVLTASQMYKREPLDRLAQLFGGSVSQHGRGEYRWRVVSGRAAEALDEMLPFLTVKAAQADAALSFQERRIGRLGRPRTDEEYDLDEADSLYLRFLKRAA